MRIAALVPAALAISLAAGCSYVDRYAFHTVAAGNEQTLPPGVSIELTLDGVHEQSNDGPPQRMYEMRVDIAQRPGHPEWLPSFDGASLQDDEGNVFPLSAWYFDSGRGAPAGVKRYRAVFELRQPYRFRSIMAATVRWKLISRGSPEFRVLSRFQS